MICAELHSRINIGRACNALLNEAACFVYHRDEDAVHDKAGAFRYLNGLRFKLAAELSDGFKRFIRGIYTAYDLNKLHDRGRIEEMHADEAVGT